MSIDAEKWDNDVEYAYERLIERERERKNTKYQIVNTNVIVARKCYIKIRKGTKAMI